MRVLVYFEGGGRRIFRITLEGFSGGVETIRQSASNVGCLNENGFPFTRITGILAHLRERITSILIYLKHNIVFN